MYTIVCRFLKNSCTINNKPVKRHSLRFVYCNSVCELKRILKPFGNNSVIIIIFKSVFRNLCSNSVIKFYCNTLFVKPLNNTAGAID